MKDKSFGRYDGRPLSLLRVMSFTPVLEVIKLIRPLVTRVALVLGHGRIFIGSIVTPTRYINEVLGPNNSSGIDLTQLIGKANINYVDTWLP